MLHAPFPCPLLLRFFLCPSDAVFLLWTHVLLVLDFLAVQLSKVGTITSVSSVSCLHCRKQPAAAVLHSLHERASDGGQGGGADRKNGENRDDGVLGQHKHERAGPALNP